MKKTLTALAIALAALSPLKAQEHPVLQWDNLDRIVSSLTLQEKVLLVVGSEMPLPDGVSADDVMGRTVPGACGATHAISRLGIPSMVMADGPAGVRLQEHGTAFPIGTALSSTWNTDLVQKVGRAMGEEAREYGIDLLMAPALNIQRNPLCGRNFEYYSEDPLLSGKMAAAAVRGIQAEGVGATIKHFAVNNQETNRVANQANVSRRALYEIYLRGFEIAVKESRPRAVMTSYNYVNGAYASESPELLEKVLRERWGFRGLVMTDWFAGMDAVAQMKAGNDLLMPGIQPQYQSLMQAVKTGKLPVKVLDRNVKHILEAVLRTESFHKYAFSGEPDLESHATTGYKAALESVVLLKNDGCSLPLKPKARIAFFGNTSYDSISGGTGSGDVNEAYTVSIVDGAQKIGLRPSETVSKAYSDYLEELDRTRVEDREGNPLYDFLAHPRDPEMAVDVDMLSKAAKQNQAAVITIGRNAGEHADRTIPGDFTLTGSELELIDNVSRVFHGAGKKVVVILNIGGVVETASWRDKADAILVAWHGGQDCGNAVAAILTGKENPSGRLPMTFPLSYQDLPGSANFPYAHGASVEEILKNVLEVRGKRYETENVDYTDYVEDIFVGYRYFTTAGRPTAYPFGFGLSYTGFTYSDIKLETAPDGALVVSLKVTNSGKTAGKEVVQLYVSKPSGNRPARELAAFGKTRLLRPGETQHVAFRLSKDDLSVYSEKLNARVVPDGEFIFTAASSSEDAGLTVKTVQETSTVLEQFDDILKPTKELSYLFTF